MGRECQITGSKTSVGNRVARRGRAKRLGGVGKKTTGITRRTFKPNLQWKRIWVPEVKRYVRVRITVKAMRTIEKDGAYKTLLRAGLIAPIKKRKKRLVISNRFLSLKFPIQIVKSRLMDSA